MTTEYLLVCLPHKIYSAAQRFFRISESLRSRSPPYNRVHLADLAQEHFVLILAHLIE